MAEDRERIEREIRDRQQRELERQHREAEERRRRTSQDHEIEKKTTDWRKPINPIKPKK